MHLFLHNILYQITLITKYQQMPYYFQPPCRFLFTAHAELQEIGPEMYFSTPNPPQWPCRSACFCTFPLMVADGHWVAFGEFWPLSSLSWVLCAALKLKKEKNRGAQQWEGIRLCSIPSVQSIFPLVHPICLWQQCWRGQVPGFCYVNVATGNCTLCISTFTVFQSRDFAEKGSKTTILWISLPSFLAFCSAYRTS